MSHRRLARCSSTAQAHRTQPAPRAEIYPGWIVGGDEDDRACMFVDRRGSIRDAGKGTGLSHRNDVPGLDAQHRQPHLMIEVIGGREDDIVSLASLGQRSKAVGL